MTIYIPHGAPMHPESRECPYCETGRLEREQRWNWDQINRLAKALDMLGQPTDKVIERALAALLADSPDTST